MAKRTELNITEQAVAAVDRIEEHNQELELTAEMVRERLRKAVAQLTEVNSELGTNAALCGSLVAQLKRAQGNISEQSERNDNMKSALLELLMRNRK